jgi:hypothetical protein
MEIKGYEDYIIYEDGLIYSKYSNKFLKPKIDFDGYEMVGLCINYKRKYFRVHRLVALTYISNPDNRPQVDHINRERRDNRVENLRWATHSQNMRNCKMFKTNTSGFTGISKHGLNYRFNACIDGKQKHIKSSEDKEWLIEFATKWKEDNNYNF